MEGNRSRIFYSRWQAIKKYVRMKKANFSSIEREGEEEGIALSVEVVNVILTADCSRNPIRVPASLFEFIHRAPTVPSNQVIVIVVVVADPREPCSHTWTVRMCGWRISTFSLPSLDCPLGRRLSDVGISLHGRVPFFFKTGTRSSSSSLAFFFSILDNLDVPARKREIIRFLRRSLHRSFASSCFSLRRASQIWPAIRSIILGFALIVKLVRIIRDQFFDRYWYM